MKYIKNLVALACLVVAVSGLVLPSSAQAQSSSGSGFSVQVTPSPLIATLDPGMQKVLELKTLNTGTTNETYKMELRSFSIDNESGKIELKDTAPDEVKDFVRFEKPEFDLNAGQWFTQRIIIDTPKDAGFSYSFAIVLSRSQNNTGAPASAQIKGSVAVFTLLTVNRPDAVRKLDIIEFSSPKKVYEYVPTDFTIKLKNSGNTIVQPAGNIFISRNENDQSPISILKVNQTGGYIIPSSERSLVTSWVDGFPAYQATDNGARKTVWDWSRLSDLRIGRYTAKLVAIYDDGQRDVPIEATLTFWVMPWKIILGAIVLLLLIAVGTFTTLKKSTQVFTRAKRIKENSRDS